MKCPGQDSRYWKPGAIFEVTCPKCRKSVEFFKDDTTRLCKNCGHRFLNPEMDFGCASYCQYAEQCLGTLSPELLAQKETLLKDRVAIEMKRAFRRDFKKIGRATRVARYAERIGKKEGGNLAVILTAAYLHQLPRDANGNGQDGPRDILTKLGAKDALIEDVCDIIRRLASPGSGESVNFKAVHDADLIAEIEDAHQKGASESPDRDRSLDMFLTESGRKIAEEILQRI
jgi:hypothetical protein